MKLIPAALLVLVSPVLAGPPETPKIPVTDTYHGVSVVDDYRWLEDWNDAKVKAWSEAQNAYARSVLDKMPNTEALRARITTLLSGGSVSYSGLQVRKGQVFAIKHEPAKQQPMLVTMPTVDEPAKARTIVDPNEIDKKGLTTIDWYAASPDGNLVAVSMSEGGSESGTVHVFDAASGKETGDLVPRAQGGTAGGSLAWAADSKGFYYTRYPHEGERPAEDLDFYMQVYFHTLGTATKEDRYEVGKDFPKIAEIMLEEVKDGGYTLASVQKGDGGEFMHWLKVERGEKPYWIQLTKWEDQVVQGTLGDDGFLYVVSRKGAPRGKVLRMSLKAAQSTNPQFEQIIAEDAKNSVETSFSDGNGVKVTAGKVFVQYQAGGPSELKVFDPAGKALPAPTLPPVCSVGDVVQAGADVLVHIQTFLTPPAWYRVSGTTLTKTALTETSPAEFTDSEVVREFATSKDGTKVPLNIIRKKGTKLDGNNPTIVWGYGGYGVNETPTFSPRRRAFVEQGGVFVVANIRGGGEYGEAWHKAGNLVNKQNVFDDYYAAAKWVIDNKYTTHDHLGLFGGSNGGLLMGAAFTQHPDLAKCVVSAVGIYDMLRVELSSNGAFNITEFGTVKDESHFKALYAYSPYHHVKDGTKYPAILMTTGANDPRVDPMQSRKMIARLQAADPTGTFLLRTSANAGHGIGSSLAQRIEENVDVYGFFITQLGVKYTTPGKVDVTK